MIIRRNVEEDYCSYEISLLLKFRDFEVPCIRGFNESSKQELNDSKAENLNSFRLYLSRPSHSVAIKWIYENCRLNIETSLYILEDITAVYAFKSLIKGDENYEIKILWEEDKFPTKEKATEKALLYALQNLIPKSC